MKRNLRLLAVGILAASIAAMVGGTAWKALAGPVLAVQGVKWQDGIGNAVANLPSDTTFQTDEADTVRTAPISTADWDWAAIGQSMGGVATGSYVRVYFVATQLNNGASDSLYFTVEQGVPGSAGGFGNAAVDSSFSYNPAGLIGSGTTVPAVSMGVGNATATGTVGVWSALLPVIPNAIGTSNVWMVPKFRLRVFGDVTGSSPKISGLRCFIVYPKRQEVQ